MSSGQAESVSRPSADAQAMMLYDTRKKKVGLAYVLWLFLGGLGAHRFYAGRMLSGAAMLMLLVGGWLLIWLPLGWFALGAVALWGLIDAFLIPGMIRDANTRLAAELGGTELRSAGKWTGRIAGDEAEGHSEANADALIARYLAGNSSDAASKQQSAAAEMSNAPVRSFGTRVRAP